MGIGFSVWANSGNVYFQDGVVYFKQKNFEQALVAFQAAKANGYAEAQLDYNLGVTYYKLQQYPKAIPPFKRLLQHEKLNAVAEYNLALIHNKLGDEKTTLLYLKRAAKSDNPKIAAIASRLLPPKSGQKSKQKTKRKIWRVYASETVGYDDNVNLASGDGASEQGDQFLQTYLKGRLMFPAEFRLSASVYDIRHEQLSAQDFRLFKLGIDRPFKWAGWAFTPGLDFSRSELNDAHFQDITDLTIKAKKRFERQTLAFRYRYSDIDPVGRFDHLAGDRHRFRVDYRVPIWGNKLRLRYQGEINDRKDEVDRSHSPERHRIEAKLSRDITTDWSVFVDVAYRNSDFEAIAGIDREDDRYQYAIGSEYKINQYLSIDAKYERTENQSNISSNDFERNVWQVGISISY